VSSEKDSVSSEKDSVSPQTPKETKKEPPSPTSASPGEREQASGDQNLQGDDNMIQITEQTWKSIRSLLLKWKQSGRSLPSAKKLKACTQLLQVQQDRFQESIAPDRVIQAMPAKTKFEELFLMPVDRLFCSWLDLQRNNPSKNGHAKDQICKALGLQKRHRRQETDSDAEKILILYSRQIQKVKAIAAIKEEIKRLHVETDIDDPVSFLMERVRLFAKSAAGNNGKFTPYPATWFRDQRYLDDEREWNVICDRTGSIKRIIPDETDEPGESNESLLDLFKKE